MTRFYPLKPLCALPVAAALILAGCGSGSSSAGEEAPPDTQSSAPSATAPTGGSSAPIKEDTQLLKGVKKDPKVEAAVPKEFRSKPITVAYNASISPMSYEVNGSPEGVEITLLKAIAAKSGVNLKFVPLSLDATIPGLQAGRLDLAVGSITDTKERQQVVDIVAYAEYGQGLAVPKGNPQHLSFKTLCGHSVAAPKGSVQQSVYIPDLSKQCKAEGKPPITLKATSEVAPMFLAVSSGRIDSALLNEVTVRYYAARSNGKLSVGDTGLSRDPKGVLVRRGSGLTKFLVTALNSLNRDDLQKKIFEHWSVGAVVLPHPKVNAATH